jgi:predicted dehydrogenase
MTGIAILGAGAIAGYHLRASQDLPDARVTWVADLDRGKAEALAATCEARATVDPAEAVAAPDVEAVIVAVPTPAHRALVELAAFHGKAVLCEKPLARTLEDAEAIVAVCRRAGVRLMVGQVVRFFPEYARLHQALREDAIGRVGVVRAARIGIAPAGSRAWFGDFAASGGVVLDMMIHELDLLRWWFGEVSRVYATGFGAAAPASGRDHAQALIRFAGGTIAHVEASWSHAAFRTTIELAGVYGILRHDSEESAALRFDLPGDGSAGPSVARRGADPIEPWRRQLRHFLDRLDDGAPFLVGGEDGAGAVELALAALTSIRTGRPVHFVDGRAPRQELGA